MSQVLIKQTVRFVGQYWRPLAGWGAVGGAAALYLVEPQFVFKYLYGSARYKK